MDCCVFPPAKNLGSKVALWKAKSSSIREFSHRCPHTQLAFNWLQIPAFSALALKSALVHSQHGGECREERRWAPSGAQVTHTHAEKESILKKALLETKRSKCIASNSPIRAAVDLMSRHTSRINEADLSSILKQRKKSEPVISVSHYGYFVRGRWEKSGLSICEHADTEQREGSRLSARPSADVRRV